MRIPWKVIGLAGLAGVAATGAVVARRRRRAHREYSPEELRERLHRRLAEIEPKASPGSRLSSRGEGHPPGQWPKN